jgi:hypothetical protein
MAMHPLFIPLGLLLLAAASSGSRAAKPGAQKPRGPTPTPPPGGGPPPQAAIKAQPIRTDPFPQPPPKITIEHPNVIPAPPQQQAAVDAVMTQVLREHEQSAPATTTRSAKLAAQDLLAFLLRTGRYGSRADRPAEVIAAQRDLGVKPDGIVGPKTRAAARKQGVAIPVPTKGK